MRVVDWSSSTHTGRVRSKNEDAYLADPPVFVVADGMGGARAGEVASRLTIEAFKDLAQDDAGVSGEELLRRTIEEANHRIRERAEQDRDTAGMGSTVTAALAGPKEIAFGHVGDSRAYLLRAGRVQQLSRDHSLVAELVRQGRLSAEEAESHPQRSVIMRVLGVEPEVEVDTWSIEAADGDVVLLCSDGLTRFVDDGRIGSALAGPLKGAVRELVRAANAAGGDDNITAVAFRVANGDAPASSDTLVAAPVDDRDTLSEADDVPVIRDAGGPAAAPPQEFNLLGEPRDGGRARGRLAVIGAALVLLTAGLVAGAFFAFRWSHFVGVDQTGHVAVYQGLPIDLGGGHTLYRETYRSGVAAATLSHARRVKLLDHTLRSSGDTLRVVQQLERGQP
jgi:serine/threonine protein phosphatase PrpC